MSLDLGPQVVADGSFVTGQLVLQAAFVTVPLAAGDWLICISVASSVLWLRELSKLLLRAFRSA